MGSGAEATAIGARLPLWSMLPFAGILLSIALGPLLAPRFWHHHHPKLAAFWALLLAVPFVAVFGDAALAEIAHTYLSEYAPFIILLLALYTASGGILLRGAPAGTPGVNALFLVVGTVLSSLIGTTGASMLLIRPLLAANAWRKSRVHIVVIFIFLVSNIGGALTPLGDPPLFLGFLNHVPFFWTLHLLAPMGIAALPLLVLFFIWDTYLYRREPPREARPRLPLRIEGAHNFIYLGGVLGAVLVSGFWRPGEVEMLGVRLGIQNIVRDCLLLLMTALSILTTRKETRAGHHFTWFPMREVAILFAGIFTTIIPALDILRAGDQGALAGLLVSVDSPRQYFWSTGALSSFLDNAPTYLTFFASALGKFYTGLPNQDAVALLIAERAEFLKAISAGAVFMGAMTYIGNAPNFMVRSIAIENWVPMPSFFGYMLKYSLPILLPIFALIAWICFG